MTMSGQSPVNGKETEESGGKKLRTKVKDIGKACISKGKDRVEAVKKKCTGLSYFEIWELKKANFRYVVRYLALTADEYLELVKIERSGSKEKTIGGGNKSADVSYDKGVLEKIEQEGKCWIKLESKDMRIIFYGQIDCQGKLTGNFKLITTRAGKAEHIERYYKIEELRGHEI